MGLERAGMVIVVVEFNVGVLNNSLTLLLAVMMMMTR